ncbi:ATP-binding protein [Streptomyces sp. NPDC058701]|uniref:ATP-binding protein n=1 Tax=Streptomyces sp. NPDC058701 TaxID=3346608 RepID=UPI00364F7169
MITRREAVAFQRRLTGRRSISTPPGGVRLRRPSKLTAARIRDLGSPRWLHSGESVILFGPVRGGKTHVAQTLGHAVRQGAHVRSAKTTRARTASRRAGLARMSVRDEIVPAWPRQTKREPTLSTPSSPATDWPMTASAHPINGRSSARPSPC